MDKHHDTLHQSFTTVLISLVCILHADITWRSSRIYSWPITFQPWVMLSATPMFPSMFMLMKHKSVCPWINQHSSHLPHNLTCSMDGCIMRPGYNIGGGAPFCSFHWKPLSGAQSHKSLTSQGWKYLNLVHCGAPQSMCTRDLHWPSQLMYGLAPG